MENNWHVDDTLGRDVQMGLNEEFVYGEIDNKVANRIIQRIIYAKAYGQSLTINFEHSADAEIGIVKMLIDVMDKYKEDVIIHTRADGELGAGASMLFINSSKGQREMAPNSILNIDGVVIDNFTGNIVDFEDKIKGIKEDNAFIIKTLKANIKDSIILNKAEKAIKAGKQIKITAQDLYAKDEVVII